MRKFSEKVKPPRTIFLRWPFGHPLGEPFHVPQQRAVLIEAFKALYTIRTPGEIIDVPFKWRIQQYEDRSFDEIRQLLRLMPDNK